MPGISEGVYASIRDVKSTRHCIPRTDDMPIVVMRFLPLQEHVTRICRIIQRPSGNAMLIGVGGSGKQSLSRLAAFICGFEVRQLSVTSKFKVGDSSAMAFVRRPQLGTAHAVDVIVVVQIGILVCKTLSSCVILWSVPLRLDSISTQPLFPGPGG